MFCVGLPKAEPCEPWNRLFQGDSDGARCLHQPYTLTGAASSRITSEACRHHECLLCTIRKHHEPCVSPG